MTALEKLLTRCELALIALALVCTVGMMLLTTFDAAGRYLFNSPLMGAYEFTEKYLMVGAIFLGLPYAFRGGIFIRVTFLVDRLPVRGRMIADHVAYIISLATCLLFFGATAQQAIIALKDTTTLNTLPLPIAPAYCIVPVGFMALAIAMAFDLPRLRANRSFLLTPDAPTA